MKIETGYLYHIKDDFFSLVNDSKLMQIMSMAKKDRLILHLWKMKFYGLCH